MMEKTPVLALDSFLATTTEGKQPAYFYANRLSAHLEEKQALISHPHKHDFYLTVFFSAGKGIHEIDFQMYEAQPGSVFLLKPGQTHYWELSPDTEGYIFFHSEFPELGGLQRFPFYAHSSSQPEIKLPNESISLFENSFRGIYAEFLSELPFRERKLANLAENVYIDLARMYEQGKAFAPQHNLERIQNLEKLIEMHYKSEKSPATYAEWMHISLKHLNRIVREFLNTTTGDLIARRVILEARRLASHSSLNLAEIARELGYEEYAYFSRFFKKATGETLSEFRGKYLSPLDKR
ncbi:MAG: hypothetical protein K0R65_1462 [Crocinitomicaceae bacterium]|jgi:AraC-like DNA-binding protein|nr:hypothetical protein [Crocinitomicaceae bacterium]